MRHLERPARRHNSYRHRLKLLVWTASVAWIDLAFGQGAPAPSRTAPPPAGIEQPEPPVAFEAVRPGPPAPLSPAAAPQPDNLPDLSSIGSWSIPPIRWGGNTTSNYAWNNSSNTKSFNETQTLNLHGSSYIYQPWYAQVAGNVGVLSGKARQGGGESANSSSRNTSFTYGGNLNLFPQSRFPFQAYLQSSDSRASANVASAQYTSMRIGARQSYRPEKGPESYSASADRSIVESGSVRSVMDALQGNFGTSLGDHSLSANARYSRNTGDVAGQGFSLLNLGGSHSWRSEEDLTVASSASYSNNQISMLNGTGLATNNTQMVQLGSSVTWLPDEDLPLTIVGGGSFLHMNTVTEIDRANLANFNGYGNASYRFSENLTGTAGATVSQMQASGTRQLATAEMASLSYSGNPLKFGDYSYNWGAGTSLSHQTVTGGGSSFSAGGNIQHSVLRDIALNDTSAITFNASQSIGLTHNSAAGQSTVLTHAGGATWRLHVDEHTLGLLSTMVSDTMTQGAFRSHFRSLSASGNLQAQISRRQTLTAGMNFVASQQLATTTVEQTVAPNNPDLVPVRNGSTTLSGSGQVGYAHRSPFDISNLIYSGTFQVNASQTNLQRVAGDPGLLGWQTGQVFQQNLDYRFGRLMFRVTNSFATFNGKKNASLFFMIGREIGDF